jgi:exopolysaccharide biosynthesis WecB/TagA/CpsF family protein
MVHCVDDFDLAGFTDVAARFGQERYGFVVTPNVDHLIRFHEDAVFRAHYRAADYVLMESQVAARLVRLFKGSRLPVCTGSDLTHALLSQVATPADRLVVIGGTPQQVAKLAAAHCLNIAHHDPPMGFIKDPQAVEECLTFVEAASPFRFCFLAVGSPQQETIAHLLKTRGVARGLVLCAGASLNYLTGSERRAPVWVRRLALEWLFRLLQDPRRLGKRYLVRGPRIFRHLRHAKFELRKPVLTAEELS